MDLLFTPGERNPERTRVTGFVTCKGPLFGEDDPSSELTLEPFSFVNEIP